MILLALALQSAAAPPAPERFSILVPVPNEPCVRRGGAAASEEGIIVCGRALPSQALPVETVPYGPTPSNPNRDGAGALAAEATPCAARIGGCQTGVDVFGAGTAAVRLAQKLIAPSSCCEAPGEATNVVGLGKDVANGIGAAFRKKPDKSKRVAIDLDAPAPTGTIER